MTTKSERRDVKRKKREEGKRLRGNRRIFLQWLQQLKRSKLWKAGALRDTDVRTR